MLPTALAAMKAGGCSMARMTYAAPAAVGSAAINAPMNGPERSTTTEMKTTTAAVVAILKRSSSQNERSGDIIRSHEVRAQRASKGAGPKAAAVHPSRAEELVIGTYTSGRIRCRHTMADCWQEVTALPDAFGGAQ